MCGKTTTSRSGSSGSVIGLGGQNGMTGHVETSLSQADVRPETVDCKGPARDGGPPQGSDLPERRASGMTAHQALALAGSR